MPRKTDGGEEEVFNGIEGDFNLCAQLCFNVIALPGETRGGWPKLKAARCIHQGQPLSPDPTQPPSPCHARPTKAKAGIVSSYFHGSGSCGFTGSNG